MDMEVLDEAAWITSWLIFGWLGLRLFDILVRGAILDRVSFGCFAGVFWDEVLLVAFGGYLLRRSLQDHDRQNQMFLGYILVPPEAWSTASVLLRLAFRPDPEASLLPGHGMKFLCP